MTLPGLRKLAAEPLVREAAAALGPRESAWVVGGVLRDLALGRAGPVVDLDLAVTGSAEGYARRLARRLKAACVTLDAAHGIYRVVPKAAPGRPSVQVDVARVQGAGIGQDLARRDFTVDAMAADLRGLPEVLDPFGGLADAAARRLRAVAKTAFDEDPLRALRVFRIAARCGLEPEPRTAAWAKAARAGLSACAAERVRAEVMALLGAPDSAAWLRRLDDAALLTTVFPELEPSRRCALAYYGKGGVLTHALATVERIDFLLAGLERAWPSEAAAARAALAAGPGGEAGHPALLRLGGLLHDVSKPETAKRREGRLRFFGHDLKGAERSEGILERLRFSREEADWVSAWVLHHLRPGNLAAGGPVTDKAAWRFFRDLGPKAVSQLMLCWGDHASYLPAEKAAEALPSAVRAPGAPLPRWAKGDAAKTIHHMRVVHELLARSLRDPDRVRPERLVDGRDVMKALGLKPGPAVGEALKALEEAQAEGAVRSRAEALAWLRRRR